MKILLTERNPAVLAMLRDLLGQWGYDVETAEDGEQACALLEAEDGPRLAVLDWATSGIDGVTLCRRVRAASRTHYVYILLLTAKTHSQDVVMGIQAGADDYVTKPFDPDELCARLWAGRRILELQEQLLQAREALREQATRDGLTGLWNRVTILDILDREIARARREDGAGGLSVVMADLDHFKEVNDVCGHVAGDAVLRQAAERMHANVRKYDAVGRYGGEEFLVVIPGCDLQGGIHQAERLRSGLGSPHYILTEGSLPVTCSLGVAWSSCAGPVSADQLVREADTALYTAKRNGRNRVEVFGGEVKEEASTAFLAHAGASV